MAAIEAHDVQQVGGAHDDEEGRLAEDRRALRDLLLGASRAVFFGGAGVSTESGIPDFRSAHGVYRTADGLGYPPETIVSHSFFEAHPREFWRFYRERMVFPDARPNACHRTLAALEAHGHLNAVVTQNIDGLHQAAGSMNVFELHGSVHRNHCLGCGATFTLAEALALLDAAEDGVPRCPACGAPVRPDVVLYEEPLDDLVMTRAVAAIASADVLVVAGTSLAVWPAAGFLRYFRGDRLVVANMTPTSADHDADLVLREPVGRLFDWDVS